MAPPAPVDRTVLVTGGAGFIGSHLVDALVSENEVRVLDDLSAGDRANLSDAAALYEGDVREASLLDRAITGVDLVYHEAAMVDVEASVRRPRECHDVNVAGSLAVLEAARAADARVILASSAAVYGRPERTPIAENDPKAPTNPYGVSKLAADEYCRVYHDLYGLETVALRYFNVYGPRQSGGPYSGVIDAFLGQALAGEALTVHGDGHQTRDFVHVDDVVRANLAAASTDVVGGAFNVGTGVETSVLELAELVREAVDSDVGIDHVEPRAGDVEASRADSTRAREGLGFEAGVGIDEGLRDLVARVEGT